MCYSSHRKQEGNNFFWGEEVERVYEEGDIYLNWTLKDE